MGAVEAPLKGTAVLFPRSLAFGFGVLSPALPPRARGAATVPRRAEIPSSPGRGLGIQ